MLTATLLSIDTPNAGASRRRSARFAADGAGWVTRDGAQRSQCRVVDISTGGVGVECFVPLDVGATVLLGLPVVGGRLAHVIWSEGVSVGLSFEQPIADQDVAQLRFEGGLAAN